MLTASNVQLNADVIKGFQRLTSIVEPFRINMVNGSTSEFTTYYNISNGNADFTYQIPLRSSFSIQITAKELTGFLDAKLELFGSNDNVNWAYVSSVASQRIVLSTTPDTWGWTKSLVNFDYIKVAFTANNCTGGSLNLLMVLK